MSRIFDKKRSKPKIFLVYHLNSNNNNRAIPKLQTVLVIEFELLQTYIIMELPNNNNNNNNLICHHYYIIKKKGKIYKIFTTISNSSGEKA